MYARAVDDAGARLRELRHEEWGDLGLAGVALVLALAATRLYPALAVPLLAGGLAVGALGLRALWLRWDLLDMLAGERDAHVISEVLSYAEREAAMPRRRCFAALLRSRLTDPATDDPRLEALAGDLARLADELADESLRLDPAAAVDCMRLLYDPSSSPLLDPHRAEDELRRRILGIETGFRGDSPTD